MNWLTNILDLAYVALAESQRAPADPVEWLCAEAGWTVNERDGATAILHFNDPVVGVRKLSISAANGTLTISTSSIGVFPVMPHQVTEYLLGRNARLAVGAWTAITIRQGVALFLIHRTPLNGLTGETFRFACEAIAHESHDLDAKLTDSGFLT